MIAGYMVVRPHHLALIRRLPEELAMHLLYLRVSLAQLVQRRLIRHHVGDMLFEVVGDDVAADPAGLAPGEGFGRGAAGLEAVLVEVGPVLVPGAVIHVLVCVGQFRGWEVE